jgi:hypothetical protein
MVIGEERSEDNNKLSCVLLQTLSYNGASATDLPNPPTSTVTTPRKRRLGEAAPTLTAAPLRPSPPTTIDADLSLVMSLWRVEVIGQENVYVLARGEVII